MSQSDERNAYSDARRAFEEMEVDKQVVFLLEAAGQTLARGIERASQALADEIDSAFRTEAHGEEKPGSAEAHAAESEEPTAEGDDSAPEGNTEPSSETNKGQGDETA